MKRVPRKSSEEKQETELVIKLNGQVVFTKETVENLTMLDTIVLAVSIMFLPVLFLDTPTASDNLQQNVRENE